MKARIPRLLVFCLLCAMWAAETRAATRYDEDGSLDPKLEGQRWLINRCRYNPEATADELNLVNVGHPEYDACEDGQGGNDFGAGPEQWENWIRSKGPLAPNARLSSAGANHTLDMAQTGQFQHPSPSADFYLLNRQPWQRHTDEGYGNQISGYMENLSTRARGSSGGYPSYGGTFRQMFNDLFIDTGVASRGHRQAIMNGNAREIGLGWEQVTYFESPFYWTRNYTTQDFARRIGIHFFTGTVFHDADGDGLYDEGEGIGGIEVRLYDEDGFETDWFDVSGASGSFAVPIDSIPDGQRVAVEVVNSGATPRTMSLPLGHDTMGSFTLAAGETRVIADFVQPSDDTNVGFRNTAPRVATEIAVASDGIQVSFNAMPGVTYEVEALTDLVGNGWTRIDTLVADVEQEVCIDTSNTGHRVYRVRLLRD